MRHRIRRSRWAGSLVAGVLASTGLLGVVAPASRAGEAPAVAAAPAARPSVSPPLEAVSDLTPVLQRLRALRCAHGAEAVLVVFDLDNTLLRADDALGSDAWFTWQSRMVELGVKAGFAPGPACPTPDPKVCPLEPPFPPEPPALKPQPTADELGCSRAATSLEGLLRTQGALYQLGSMSPTGPEVVADVARIQARGFPTMVLTSRGPAFRGPTRRELCRNGFSFAASAPTACGVPTCAFRWRAEDLGGFTDDELTCFKGRGRLTGEKVLYEDGVYMTSGQHKGAMLRLLLARTGLRVSAIVFVDDTHKHLPGMVAAFEGVGVPVHAFYYTATHPDVAAFLEPTKGAAARARTVTDLKALRDRFADVEALEALEADAPVPCAAR